MCQKCPTQPKPLTQDQIETLKTLRTQMGNQSIPDQIATEDQLNDLVTIANQLGLYEAADVLKNWIAK